MDEFDEFNLEKANKQIQEIVAAYQLNEKEAKLLRNNIRNALDKQNISLDILESY